MHDGYVVLKYYGFAVPITPEEFGNAFIFVTVRPTVHINLSEKGALRSLRTEEFKKSFAS